MTEVFVPVRIELMTLGEAWIAIAAAILAGGVVGSRDGLPIVEVFRATLDIGAGAGAIGAILAHTSGWNVVTVASRVHDRTGHPPGNALI